MAVKKYFLPYIDSIIDKLSIFSGNYQAAILDIVFKLGNYLKLKTYNEEIDRARFYFDKTYEAGISPENYDRASTESKMCYNHLAKSAKNIAVRIEDLKNIK